MKRTPWSINHLPHCCGLGPRHGSAQFAHSDVTSAMLAPKGCGQNLLGAEGASLRLPCRPECRRATLCTAPYRDRLGSLEGPDDRADPAQDSPAAPDLHRHGIDPAIVDPSSKCIGVRSKLAHQHPAPNLEWNQPRRRARFARCIPPSFWRRFGQGAYVRLELRLRFWLGSRDRSARVSVSLARRATQDPIDKRFTLLRPPRLLGCHITSLQVATA
jgi:hypothetical protein